MMIKHEPWCNAHVAGEEAALFGCSFETRMGDVFVNVDGQDSGPPQIRLYSEAPDSEVTPDEARRVAVALTEAADLVDSVSTGRHE